MSEVYLDLPTAQATLDSRFALAVRAHPQAIAVRDRRDSLSYAELDAEVDRVAALLSAHGVLPGSLVPLLVKPSIHAVVAIFAVLRLGAAYVPLDRKSPPERLRQVVDQCAAPVTVLDAGDRPGDIPLTAQLVLRLRSVGAVVETPQSAGTAYVMFTSGSTGQPKGVVVSHRAVLHYLDWATAEYGVQAGTGAPLFSSMAFDLSVTALFGPLLHGRTVELMDPDEWLLEFLDRPDQFEQFSYLKATPAHLSMLCTALEQEGLSVACRLIVVGGEPLYGNQVAFWRRSLRMTALVNEYGPTEAAVGCCRYWVPDDPEPGMLPIGTASPGTTLEVDGPLRGELLIGGPQLADGYLNNPAATARSFVQLPESAATGRRYRTGDLVQASERQPTEFVFLGRADSQVKLSGHRVELGDVVSHARARPEVGDAEVLLTRIGLVDALVLFVSAAADAAVPLDPAELTRQLAGVLPTYMVPHRVVVVERFPLNDRGKVDRSKLEELLS
ncbi:MAG: amino acid adenylation domain-containing protein [Actinomycetota bacterium]|nr:amino acid adenylation domain-containing protein [Actinomycetota bacterium]MDQ2956660.1 amino acid adenylation domain-containing protein [Actinomycetota bacterium]